MVWRIIALKHFWMGRKVNIQSLWEFNPIWSGPFSELSFLAKHWGRRLSSGWPTFSQAEEQYFFAGRRQLLQVQSLLISPTKVLPDFELHTLTKTCGWRRLWWQSPPPPSSAGLSFPPGVQRTWLWIVPGGGWGSAGRQTPPRTRQSRLIFWSFLTKTKPDQAFPSHVHGKI